MEVLKNPATLQRMWQNAMASIKKANPAHAVLFFNTRPVLDADKGVLIIEVDASNAFAANALQKPEVQNELQQCLDAAAGAPVMFCLQKKEGVSGGAPAAPIAPPVPSAPASAPVPPAPAAPVPAAPAAPAPAAPVETPPWDQPPVPPTGAPAPAAPPVAPAPAAPAPAPQAPASAAAPQAPAPAPAAPVLPAAPAGEEASPDELNSILSGAFGDGVVFTEQ